MTLAGGGAWRIGLPAVQNMYLGIDVGSVTTKCAGVNADLESAGAGNDIASQSKTSLSIENDRPWPG